MTETNSIRPVRLVHLFNSFHGLGGVEAILKHHQRQDFRFGLESRLIIYSEKAGEPVDRVDFLGVTGKHSIQDLRSRFSRAISKGPPQVAVYQGLWGLPYLVDLDQAARRIAVLHGETPQTRDCLVSQRGWIDGYICIGEPARQAVYDCVPGLQRERATVLPVPITPVGEALATTSVKERPLVIGFCSRLIFHQKRVDRLPELCRHLDQHGMTYRLEFLGDGPEQAWLEAQFPDRKKFVFHGRKGGEDFWRILKGWDVMVFVSDFEGTPVAMLEGLSMGVIPVYPRINSGADALAHNIDPNLLYQPGAFDQVERALQHVSNLSLEQLDQLRRRCRESVAAHLGDNYLRKFAGFVNEIVESPPIGRHAFPKRPWVKNHLSFRFLERLGAVRRLLVKPKS